jgi:hypothetical protein
MKSRPACRIRQHLAREAQDAVRDGIGHEAERRAIDLPLTVELLDDLADHVVEQRVVPLARQRADQLAGGVDEGEGRPRVHAIVAPHLEVAIVEHRVRDLVALDDAADSLVRPSFSNLADVHADDDELARVLRLERFRSGITMHAVHAAEGPEVEQHDLAAQLRDAQALAARVYPVETGGKSGAASVPA